MPVATSRSDNLPSAAWMAALLCTIGTLTFCAAPAATAAAYVDAVDYPGQGQGWDAFYDLERRLQRDFDYICGDTICEGEFSNMQALRYRCSVQQADGMMGECVWTFAASNAEIDAASGKVVVDARTWACRTPLAAQTPVATFYSALAGDSPLRAPLPGTNRTIFDGLFDCLN
ncbi:MAG: hypothetical protein JWQ61_3217 [Collimonas fungivorans]|uniref:hypothetical protein n=1 Tax=Collimonas fungivorans TaxID=158899 RepID=UPI0026F2E687|nr:hypothetical protein [Collimonas fungivorans]MDB5768403.1 hypothetical protein [Collimonas fungivorans]